MNKQLGSRAKASINPAVARMAKKLIARPRYQLQAYRCRQGYAQFGQRYPQKILFVAGLPKSGTTWIEGMLAGYPGYHTIMPPHAIIYEFANGESHNYDLPPNCFSSLKQTLAVLKLHIHGSPHNIRLLYDAQISYIILYRDLRDVALSYYFYVRQTPWHPEHRLYTRLSIEDALMTFAQRMLLTYAQWIVDWHTNRDPKKSLLIRYEDMLQEPYAIMTKVATLFELDSSPQTIQKIVDNHRFEKLSAGRKQGQQNQNSFFRKGIAGDWVNYFTPQTKEKYKQLIGDFLIEFGYERDYQW